MRWINMVHAKSVCCPVWKSAKPLLWLGASCLFSFKKKPFAFHHRQDEASKMPGIYLEFPENIFFKIKILSEKVRFLSPIQRIALSLSSRWNIQDSPSIWNFQKIIFSKWTSCLKRSDFCHKTGDSLKMPFKEFKCALNEQFE